MRAAILALLLTGCAWTPSEHIVFNAHIVAASADYMTTKAALERGGKELNPVLGEQPTSEKLALFKVLGLAAHWWVNEHYEDEKSVLFGLGLTVPSALAAAHNYVELSKQAHNP